MHVATQVALFLTCLVSVGAYVNPTHQRENFHYKSAQDVGDPLFLTPYIQAGQLDEAKSLSKVGPLTGTSIESYTGFLTVNAELNSNIFFWFIPSLTDPATAPLALWLQGGPGGSSLFALFAENGPWVIDADINLSDREFTWATPFNMLYIDNPVGTGYSFTGSDLGYPNNESAVADDLYEALVQWFTLFVEYQNSDFYLTGESYAGKYIPALGHKIHTSNPTALLKINFKGLAMGDPWIDPYTQYDYGDYFYNVGLIDAEVRAQYLSLQAEMVDFIGAGDYAEALTISDQLVPGLYSSNTGLYDTYNYLLTFGPVDQNYYELYVIDPDVRASIHVGGLTYNNGQQSSTHLTLDIMKSTRTLLEELLSADYRVLIYTGQVDVIVPYFLTMNLINQLNWTHAENYKTAERLIWKVDPTDAEIAGYVKQSFNFYEILVRDAGHILPYDQPRVALDMITRFVLDQPFTD